jgi:hypothetical protein
MVMDPLTARCVTAVYHYRKVIPLEQNNPNKSENKTIRQEFLEFLKGIERDSSLIDNNAHVNQMLEKIYKFSIDQKHKENNKSAQEILDAIRARKSNPMTIFPEDLDHAWQEGLDEGRRLGRESVRSIAALFDSNDWYNDYTDTDSRFSHGRAYDKGVQSGLDYASDNGWKGESSE